MRLTELAHACLHIQDEDASVPIGPGAFSPVFWALRGRTGASQSLERAATGSRVLTDGDRTDLG